MELIDKANILSELSLMYSDDERWSEFFSYHDLAMPYAFGLSFGHILELSPEGDNLIESAWLTFCDILRVDPNADWDGIISMFRNADFSEE